MIKQKNLSAFLSSLKQKIHPSPFVIYILLLCIIPQMAITYLTFMISEKNIKLEMENKLHSTPDNEISTIDHYISDMDNNAKILADNSSVLEDIATTDALENPQQIDISEPISPNIDKVSQNTVIAVLEFQLTHIEQLRSNILWIAGITIPLLSFILYKLSRKLERSKEFLDNIINSMPSPMIILDDKAKIMLWNHEAEKQSSTTLEKVKGKPITEIFNYLESEKQKILAAIHSNEPQKIDKIPQQTTQGKAYFELLIYPLKGKKIHGTALLIQDITERIRLMESLQQQEHMASIGMLVAGIAHEINNPVNFITANVKSIKNDLKDVLEVLNQYSQITASSINDFTDFKNSIDKINAFKQEVNLVYTIDEIEKLLAGLEEGAQRTATIVKGLRTFSRVNDTEMISTDILEGIESTLALLSNSCKDRIDIVREYEQIPLIDCYEGKLNQVFMNLLSNAVCAIKGKGKIYIKVFKGLNSILISIRDTGEGIKEVNKPKIFMPFFTTKDVGQGTGLGLSITYNIILEHHGTLIFNSEEGNGTEFIITLPFTHPKTV